MRTNESNDVDFLTELILKTSSDPITISACVGRVSDASEHITRDHDEGGRDGCQSPCPARLEKRCGEAKREED